MRLQVIRANIDRYERLLRTETDPVNRDTFQSLLAEARAEEALIIEELRFEDGDIGPWGDALRWRMRAEEYRAVADAMHNDGARHAYLRLARDYDALAGRAERRAAGESKPLAKVDQE
jgi:hypothetical protein